MKGKKVLAMLLSGAMLLTTSVLAPFTASAEVTQIFSDGFEDGYGGWAPRGDATVEITSDTAYAGEDSLYISSRTKAWHGAGCAKIKELRAGYTYNLSAWVMYETGNSTEQINFAILYKDANGTEQYKQIANTTASQGVWTQVTNTAYTVPSDATNVTIYFETPSNLIDFYIDEITAEGEPYESEETEGFNDDFESGMMEWSGRGAATCTQSTTYSHGGEYSLYTTGRTSLWNGPCSNKTLVLNAGNYYKFSAWVLYDGADWTDTQKFSLYLQYQQAGKECYYEVASSVANKGEWTYIESECTLPSDASNFIVYLQTGYVTEANVTEQSLMDFYIDDVVGERLPDPAIQSDITSLSEAYADYFRMGCAVTATELETPATQELIKKHYKCLTVGNELKPDSVLNQSASLAYLAETGDDTNPQVSLDKAAPILEFCQENGIAVRGHVLVWHSQTPDWFFKENFDANGAWVSETVMLQRLENYIKNVMEAIAAEYPDLTFYAWDVVNEAVSDAGGIREAGSNNTVTGQSAWVQVFGDQSYIEAAFTYAREYAPAGCKLFYNDYNEYTAAKRDTIYGICEDLAAKGLIDGVGMQSHVSMSYPTISLYEEAIRKYASLGLEVQITELDVSLKSNADEDMLALAQRYRELFQLYKKVVDDGVNLTAVVLWGITDSTSWIGGYPLLFDKNYQAKAAYYAVIDTDAEIQTISIANAIAYDGTIADLQTAFELQAAQPISDKGSFKLAWSGDKLVVQVTAAVDGTVRVMGDAFTTITKSMTAGETQEIIVTPGVDSAGDTFRFDIAINDIAWNSLEGYAGVKAGFEDIAAFGKVIYAAMPKCAEAAYGTPTLDGTIDSIWSSATAINCDTYTLGSGATAKARMLWDENYIYVLMEVTDPVLSNGSANAYEQDTVEVFFDENNNKTTSYQSDDIQCRISYLNDKTVTDGKTTDDFDSAAATVSGGYIVEIAVPYTIAPFTAGQVVGFDVQVNDDGGENKRSSIANWSDLTGLGYINTAGYGVLRLVGDASAETYAVGDVNKDGDVSIADLILLNRYLVRKISYVAPAVADIDRDGIIDAFDAVLLKKSFLA